MSNRRNQTPSFDAAAAAAAVVVIVVVIAEIFRVERLSFPRLPMFLQHCTCINIYIYIYIDIFSLEVTASATSVR